MDGTRIACEIVLQAQRMGVHAIVADYNEPSAAPAKLIADEHHLVDLTDVDAVVDLIRREHIDGVVAGFSDRMLPYYARICSLAGLPCYGTKDLFDMFTDKDVYKQLCRQFDVPIIEEYDLQEIIAGRDAEVRYPVIVKPVRGSGSRGVTVCHDRHAVIQATDQGTVSEAGSFLVERYLRGPEATVFWVFQDGKHYVSAVANRHVVRFDNGQAPLPFAYTMPSSIAPRYLDIIAPRARKMFSSVGVRNGMMFMQGIIDDGVFRTYDIGYRVTGTQEYRLIESLSGYNPLEMIIAFALTGTTTEPRLESLANPLTDRYGFNVSVLMRPGRVGSIDGLEESRRRPSVVSAIATRDPGDELPADAAGQLRQVTVRILGTAETPYELRRHLEDLGSTVRVRSVDEEDLTIHPEPIGDLEHLLL